MNDSNIQQIKRILNLLIDKIEKEELPSEQVADVTNKLSLIIDSLEKNQ